MKRIDYRIHHHTYIIRVNISGHALILYAHKNVEEAEIECILVNDCTPDNSMEVVRNKLKDYIGGGIFKTIRLDKNSGHCVARNAGIRISTGDYILFVDSDDILEPGTISYFLEGIRLPRAEDLTWMSYGEIRSDNSRNAEIMHFDSDNPVLIDNSDESALRKMLSRDLIHTSWNKLVKRTLFTEQQLYFQGGIINEDQLWSGLCFSAKSKRPDNAQNNLHI